MAITNEITVRLVECAKPLNSTSGIIGWNDTNTIPKKGELCLEYTNTGTDVNPHYIYKMKVGDGYHPYTNLEYFPASQNIVSEIVTWVNANLDVTEYAQAEFVAGTTNTDPYVKIYGIKEVDGKIVRGSSYLKITGGTHITIQQSGNDVVIEHTGSSATETTGSALNFGSNVITAVTTDNTGHVTSVTKSPLPQTPNMSTVLSNQSSGATDTVTENPFMNLVSDNRVVSTHQIQSGSKMDVRSVTQEGTFNVLVSHQPTTRTDTTSATQPTALATAITTDTTGHVTEVTTVDPDDVTVGKAKDLESPITENDDTTWNYRETGGEISIGEDIARVSKLKGNTIVWNQLNNNGILNKWSGVAVATRQAVGRAQTFTITNAGLAFDLYTNVPLIQNSHKVYFRISITPSFSISGNVFGLRTGRNASARYFELTANKKQTVATINSVANGEQDTDSYFVVQNGRTFTVGDEFTIEDIQVIDLTKMFGSDINICASLGVADLIDNQGNLTIDTTKLNTAIANFEKLFPNTYYPYCEGRLVNLGGYGIKWNQLVQNGNFANGTTGWSAGQGGVLSVSDGVAALTKTATGTATYAFLNYNVEYVEDHKYLVFAYVKSNNSGSSARVGIGNTSAGAAVTQYTYYADWTRLTLIGEYNPESSGTKVVSFRAYNGSDPNQDASASFKNVMCFDLTEMFGPGSEPTLEEFEAMFPDDYYEYNEGTEMNIFDAAAGENKLGLESIGFNQWDEIGEVGNMSSTTGQNANSSSGTNWRSVNYIPVIPGGTYYCKSDVYTSARMYDFNKNFVPEGNLSIRNSTFDIPLNVSYLRFVTGNLPQQPICINISDPKKNGTYEPYKKDTLDLDWVRNIEYTPDGSSTPEKLFPQGLLSAGSVYDEVGENYAIKRVGVVDLGILSWTLNSAQVFQSRSLGTIGYNALCKKYLFAGKTDSNVRAYNKGNLLLSIYTGGDYRIYIRDDSYSDEETFKNSLSGVMLYYELETPVVVYFDEKKKLTYFVDDHGTEQQLPVNSSSIITSPFIGTFEYKSNFKDAVIDLIDTVNSYKNPVRGQNNTAQTVGELAVYDSDSTVSSSGFKASNGTITTSVTDKDKKLPTIESVIEYVQRMTQSAIHYLGVINSADRLVGPHAMGDMFIAGTTFPLDGKQIDVGDYLIKNSTEYVSGIPLSQLWDVIQGKVSVSNAGATLVMNGTSHTIANVEGTQITVTTPNLNATSPTTSGTEISFIDTVSQSNGQLSATKKTIQSASKTQSGVVQFVSDIHNSVDGTKAVTAADAWTEFAKRNVKASVVSSTTPASIIPQVVYSSQLPTSGVAPDNWNALVFGRWSSTPLVIGMLYIHLPEKKAYISVGTEAPTDWKMITNI